MTKPSGMTWTTKTPPCEITSAASEQSAKIDNVNTAIGVLDQMTQQKAALVEESSTTSDSLREQAQRLKDIVEVFKIYESWRA